MTKYKIAHDLQGVEQKSNSENANQITSQSQINDSKHSNVFGTSLFAEIIKGEDVTVRKNSDDKIVVGYSNEGLPFQIATDGFRGCQSEDVFQYINKLVVPSISGLIEKLKTTSSDEKAKACLQNHIKNVFKYRPQNRGCEMTMSLVVTYYNVNEELHCAGYGIGDIGVVARCNNNTLIQLTSAQQGKKDAFCDWNENRIKHSREDFNTLFARNSIFVKKIQPGDEICCYTFAMYSLTEKVWEDTSLEIEKHNLIASNFDLNKDLYQQFIDKNKVAFETAKNDTTVTTKAATSEEKEFARIGDDFTVSSTIIPNIQLQNQLKKEVAAEPEFIESPDVAAMNAEFIDANKTPKHNNESMAKTTKPASETTSLLPHKQPAQRCCLIL